MVNRPCSTGKIKIFWTQLHWLEGPFSLRALQQNLERRGNLQPDLASGPERVCSGEEGVSLNGAASLGEALWLESHGAETEGDWLKCLQSCGHPSG